MKKILFLVASKITMLSWMLVWNMDSKGNVINYSRFMKGCRCNAPKFGHA